MHVVGRVVTVAPYKNLCLFLAMFFFTVRYGRLLRKRFKDTMGSPNITTSAALGYTSRLYLRLIDGDTNLSSCRYDSCKSWGLWQMTCLPDCGRLSPNRAAFAVFTPALPSCSHRHCCSRAKNQPGRIRTPRQAGLAAGQTRRQRSTGLGHCPRASSSGWEGLFLPHAR